MLRCSRFGAVYLLVFLLRSAVPQAGPPNILFLFGDDHSPDAVGAFGNPYVRTPHIDRLASSGYRFSSAYCMGSMGGAVCVPSRAMLNSGRTLLRAPSDLEGVQTLPEVLSKAGYTTFITGKWHNQESSLGRAFEQGQKIFVGGMSNHRKVPVVDIVEAGRLSPARTGKRFSSRLFADAAIQFLRRMARRPASAPFYAYVAFTAPHDPRQPPGHLARLYYRMALPLPVSFAPQHGFDNGWMTGRDENLAPWPRTADVIRDQLAEYYGMITHMDSQIGRILKTLEETGLDRNTIVLYSADHGLALGRHGLLGKQNLYEHSMGAPLVISGPGIPKGQVTEALVYLFDLFPTLCELARATVPEGTEGQSLIPILKGEKDSLRDSLFTLFEHSQRALRDARYKLIRYPLINRTQLFDLAEDPHEVRDLASKPEHRDRISMMMSQMEAWQREIGDDAPLSTDNPHPSEIDLAGRARSPDRHQPGWIVRKYFSVRQ